MRDNYSVIIDQSGKVEDFNTSTAIAYSTRGESGFPARAVKIRKDHKSIVKGEAKKVIGSSKKIHLKMFSVGTYMVTKPHIDEISEIIIDEEYEGNDHLIKNYLINFYMHFSDLERSEIPDLKMDLVHNYGEGDPECHELAKKVRANKVDPHFQPGLKYLKKLVLPSR